MQKWLARFSFSFIILAAVMIWRGYQLQKQNDPREQTNIAMLWVGGGVLFGLGLAGVRARHRNEI